MARVRRALLRAAGALATLGVLAGLAACAAEPPGPAKGSALTVLVTDPLTTLNGAARAGQDDANAAVLAATAAPFFRFDSSSQLVADPEVGTATPQVPGEGGVAMSVSYALADGLAWSDGVPVDAADLLLAWAAGSGVFNTPGVSRDSVIDPASGAALDAFTPDIVFFDARSGDGLDHAKTVPVITGDGRAIVLSYDAVQPDWRLLLSLGLAAHQLGRMALGVDDPQQAKSAVVAAIQNDDTAALAKLSKAWSTAFALAGAGDGTPLPLGAGPLVVTAVHGGGVDLGLNPAYTGSRKPPVETIHVAVSTDPAAAVAALKGGTADVVVPRATQETLDALPDDDSVTRVPGYGGLSEHIDLQLANGANGALSNPLVRQAFLKALPRPEIVQRIVAGFNPDAKPLDSFVATPPQPDYAELVANNGSVAYAAPDPAAAAALLASAGASSPTVCILYDPSNGRRALEFQLIQQAEAAAGFTVTDCSRPDWLDYLGVPGAYDAAIYAWQATSAIAALQARYGSADALTNFSWYANPAVDAAIAGLVAGATAGPGGATATPTADGAGPVATPPSGLDALAAIDGALWADAFGAPLYQEPALALTRPDVRGVALSPYVPGVLWSLADWKVANPA